MLDDADAEEYYPDHEVCDDEDDDEGCGYDSEFEEPLISNFFQSAHLHRPVLASFFFARNDHLDFLLREVGLHGKITVTIPSLFCALYENVDQIS
jgi:hypothetical protein